MKKSKNTSPQKLGNFIKIVGQYINADDERTRITIGTRWDYDKQKSRLIIRVEKLDEEGKCLLAVPFTVKKKDITKIISCLKFVETHGVDFIDSLDEEIND